MYEIKTIPNIDLTACCAFFAAAFIWSAAALDLSLTAVIVQWLASRSWLYVAMGTDSVYNKIHMAKICINYRLAAIYKKQYSNQQDGRDDNQKSRNLKT